MSRGSQADLALAGEINVDLHELEAIVQRLGRDKLIAGDDKARLERGVRWLALAAGRLTLRGQSERSIPN